MGREKLILINKTVTNKKICSTEETIKSHAASVMFCFSFERKMWRICKESTGPIGKKLFIRLFSAHMNWCSSMDFCEVLAKYLTVYFNIVVYTAFSWVKKFIMRLYWLCNDLSEEKLRNYAIVCVKQQAGQNVLMGLFYLLWFESLSKHRDAAWTKAKQTFWFLRM